MSLDKAIEHKKEKRKPYKGSKAFDRTCRNNNSCSWCRGNKLFSTMRRSVAAEDELNKLWNETDSIEGSV